MLQALRWPLVHVVMPAQFIQDVFEMAHASNGLGYVAALFSFAIDLWYFLLFLQIDDDDFWGKRRRALAKRIAKVVRALAPGISPLPTPA